MATFTIARAGSSYPRVTRSEVPVGAIFKGTSYGSLSSGSFINLGTLDDKQYSIGVNNYSLYSTTNHEREVAIVGKVMYRRTFFDEAEYADKRITSMTVGDIFLVKNKVNDDKLPIAFGLLGHNDAGEYLALDFNEPGKIVKFRPTQMTTVVGKFGIVGTEV